MPNAVSAISSSLLSNIAQFPDKPIVVAYSGGVDSQVLLHALSELRDNGKITQPIMACHVNHGLSENATLWETAAQAFCHKLNIALKVVNVVIDINAKESIEELARNERYNALVNVSSAPAVILTGHHSDDQVETFLLALKRGAGIKGLSAMPLVSTLEYHKLVRPLLEVSRETIQAYAQQQQLTWQEDESNQDQRFDRNFLRQSVIPALSARWPSIGTTIKRSAIHCRDAQQLLDEIANEDLEACTHVPSILCVSALLSLSANRFNNCVRYFLKTHHKLMPSTQQLQQLRQQLTAETDKNPAMKVNDYWLRRYKNHLYLTEEFANVAAWQTCLHVSEPEQAELTLPDSMGTLKFNAIALTDQIVLTINFLKSGNALSDNESKIEKYEIVLPVDTSELNIRFTHDNPTCLPDYRAKSRPLKKVIQELSIPTWQRNRIPFLYAGDKLVAALGYFVCKPYLAND